MPKTEIDFAALRAEIRDAARATFAGVRKANPKERFYGYALYTDDDRTSVVPALNSEEGYRRQLKKAGKPADEDDPMYRWYTSEWAYEAPPSPAFDAICKKLFAWSGDPAVDDFKAFKRGVSDAMIGGLADLEAEGFFGTGPDRDGVYVFCTISDSDNAEKLENRSAKQLNPERVAKAFAKRMKA